MKYMYDSAIWAVKGNDYANILEQDSGIFFGTHDNVQVFNIGRTDVYCVLRYGTKFQWIGNITSANVKAGEETLMKNGGGVYYVTGLKVQNDMSKRAIVCGHFQYGGGGSSKEIDFDISVNNIARQLAAAGLKFVPYVGDGLSALLLEFWPEQKKSIWDQVKEQVEGLVDKKIIQTVSALLEGDINQYKEQIKTVLLEIENNNQNESTTHYMNIAQQLIGFENKFIFGKSHPDRMSINQALLPLYSHVIHMKMLYYCIGIDQASKIGLTEANLRDIQNYADRLLNEKETGVKKYINDLYKDHVDYTYDTCVVATVYNSMMSSRTYISVNGLEYLPIWDYMLKNPCGEKDPKVYNDAISYSLYYGRQTSNLARIACMHELEQPLTPKLLDGRRNKIASVEVSIWRIYGTGQPKIGGMRVNFENGDSHFMGRSMDESQIIEWNGARLNKLTVWGRGALDLLEFEFSDGRKINVGTNDASFDVHDVLEMENHHIVGIYLANDFSSTGGQANNIAVSFQLTVE